MNMVTVITKEPIIGAEFGIGKLAMWRINTHSLFGGTWLSDYQPNYLGVDRTASECNEIE